MNSLEEHIIRTINEKGPITFERFMDMALYYPELGYYSNPEARIGRHGDFYTSPHLHPVFGAVIARQLVEMWEAMGMPEDFHTIEAGAGAGHLSRDILDHLTYEKHPILGSLKHTIIEPYTHFKKMQQDLLTGYSDRIQWVRALQEAPRDVCGCMFSNELFDAFPVHLIEMDGGIKEVCIGYESDKLVEVKKHPGRPDIAEYLKIFSPALPDGYRTEVNLKAQNWLMEAASKLSSGFILTIDYGYTADEYYNDERNRGTLLCYHKHMINEDTYSFIGEQDITTHLNFSSLHKTGEENGLKTLGYTSQGSYLVASGIDKVITEKYAGSPDYMSEIKKIKGLIMPEGMGESHMVMIQYKGKGKPELSGFGLRNNANKL